VNRFLGIERFDYEEAIRCVYARELPNGNWVDVTRGVKLFNIHWQENDEVEKRIIKNFL